MRRMACLAYGLVCYAIFFAIFLYLVAFVGDLPFAPVTVDRGPAAPWPVALIVDIGLIALFGVQHSVMARPGFKARWTRMIPRPVERSTYLLFSSAALVAMYAFWRPIPAPVWTVGAAPAEWLFRAVFAAGWLIVLSSTFLIDHFELFGLRQVVLHWRGRAEGRPVFRKPLFYRLVRHPLYSGFLLAFWATPAMTAGHLVFALGMTAYVLIAIRYEERDLTGVFGEEYSQYRKTVGMLAPRLSGRAGGDG